MGAVLVVCGVLAGQAQPPLPHRAGPLQRLLVPHQHAEPAPPNPEHIPEVIFDATAVGSPVVLDKNWRVGVTASQDPARADFDDTTWAVRDAKDLIADVPDEDRPPDATGPPGKAPNPYFNGKHPPGHQRPWVWFRLHIKLAPNHGPQALLVELPVTHTTNVAIGAETISPEVYVNGRLVHPEGPHGDHPERFQSISRLYKLDVASDQTSVVLVLRSIFIANGFGAYTEFFSNRTLWLGAPQDLGHALEIWNYDSLFERLPRLVTSILLVVLSLFLLALYFTQKGHPEYLWLALHELAQAPLAYFELQGSTAQLDQLVYAAVMFQLLTISAYFYFEFLVSFLDLKHRWAGSRRRWFALLLRYTAPIMAGAGPGMMMLGHSTSGVVFLVVVALGTMLWLFGWLLFCIITLIGATIRRNFEAGLLLFPLVLSIVGLLEGFFANNMSDWTGHSYQSPLTLQAGPIPIHFATIADFVGLLAIVVIIFFRFLRIHRDRERASSELAAARSVQELLIPQEKLKTPGFEVDSIYNPAQEVGGDFYHVESTDGGLLVVIGDVAGKGLKAAMNVSMVMGALRRTPDRNPAKILESLNRVLAGSESFTTCQAAWFGSNGELVIANAGHLSPYLNTQEVNLPGGLPLGVIPEVSYEEVRLYLHPGDRLLLMSDGVVEARQSNGELFGFDRVHNLSNQSAFYIADAAKSFGQEDDITVLTVRRMAAAAAA